MPDTFRADILADLLYGARKPRVRDKVAQWAPELNPKQHALRRWLGDSLRVDKDLDRVLLLLCRRLGFRFNNS